MNITKFGHCCLLIEENNLRILLDPGNLSTGQNDVKNVHVVLITHEHPDHCHIDSVKAVLKNHPETKIYTNESVQALLEKEGITSKVIADGTSVTEKGILIEGFGKDHACIHDSIPLIRNRGYFIANKFFYPGDSFTKPPKTPEILALPIVGFWMKLQESMDFATEVKPKICFPVHDGILAVPGPTRIVPPQVLEPLGIKYEILELGKEYEF